MLRGGAENPLAHFGPFPDADYNFIHIFLIGVMDQIFIGRKSAHKKTGFTIDPTGFSARPFSAFPVFGTRHQLLLKLRQIIFYGGIFFAVRRCISLDIASRQKGFDHFRAFGVLGDQLFPDCVVDDKGLV